MEQRQVILIIARPSRLRDGLEALIAAMPQIDVVTLVTDGILSPEMVAETYPALVLLDTDAFDCDCESAVSTVKAAYPDTKCVVLVNTLYELLRARGTGADGILFKGFSGTKLYRLIGELLPQSTSYMHLGG